MSNPRPPRRNFRAARLALCEALESRILLAADAVIFDPIVSFQTRPTGSRPQGLVVDSSGNLYGVTSSGGAKNYGTVFKIAADTHQFSTLDSFTGANGISPSGNLFLDPATGLLYGTTAGGGAFRKGTIFTINVGDTSSSSTHITTLASFDGVNGSYPLGGLVADAEGNLYGTATGSTTRGYASTVWTLAASDSAHTITALATFKPKDLLSGQLATTPDGLLATDADGNIFGTTRSGGTKKLGSIFQINPDHSVTTLASLSSTTGTSASGALIRIQSTGDFIGTAINGGQYGYGTLFQFSSASGLSVIGTFNRQNGARPLGNLIVDNDGNIFGVTSSGGVKNYGTVFQRAAGTDNTISTVYELSRQRDGLNPTTLVVNSGHFFVSTFAGGDYNAGAIFELSDTPIVFAPPPSIPPLITPTTLLLNILQQPTTIAAGQTFSLLVNVRVNQTGFAILSGTVTLSINAGPEGGALAGTPTINFVLGIATFSDLSFTIPGLYTLQVTAPSLVSTLTTTITVT